MKKIAIISLLIIYLMSTTELHQLMKLPFMVEHYFEHKNKNNSLTFFEFLIRHYSNVTVLDEDYSKDMKLPFKSNQGCTDITIKAPVANPFNTVLLKPINIGSKTFTLYNDMFLPSFFLPNIWQPPKSC